MIGAFIRGVSPFMACLTMGLPPLLQGDLVNSVVAFIVYTVNVFFLLSHCLVSHIITLGDALTKLIISLKVVLTKHFPTPTALPNLHGAASMLQIVRRRPVHPADREPRL